MFDGDIIFVGKHADYLRQLAPSKQYKEKTEQRKTFFNSNIEVVLAAAAIGFIKGKKAELARDAKVSDNRIFYEAVSRHKEDLELVYRLIMILDAKNTLSVEKRIDKAFRFDADDEKRKSGDEVFWAYVRGGIEYLYDVLYKDSESTQDDIQKAAEFVESFKATYIDDGIIDEIYEICSKSKI